ncbi:HNH endonuclease [Sunxiuqinia indica]|uniref:HNH endonuclease n=1 Tax=Sunxiuqinia indica TaxID=2692584 RepID=UPI0013595C2A|nr:HNH endonuclease domain-containing protein [Sunxiuqinia indica]
MKKYVFCYSQKYAIWKNYDMKCFWCGEPLRIMDVTIDHIIPERLLDSEEEFMEIKEKYSLADAFQINDFCNWVPCHSTCNSKKGKRVFPGSPAFLMIIDGVLRKSEKVKDYHDKLLSNVKTDKQIGELLTNLEKGVISDSDLLILLTRTKYKHYNYAEKENKFKELIPDGWKLIDIDDYGHGVIANGKASGLIPLTVEPHHSWRCPHCHEFGPWHGSRCVNCGRTSVELD